MYALRAINTHSDGPEGAGELFRDRYGIVYFDTLNEALDMQDKLHERFVNEYRAYVAEKLEGIAQ